MVLTVVARGDHPEGEDLAQLELKKFLVVTRRIATELLHRAVRRNSPLRELDDMIGEVDQ